MFPSWRTLIEDILLSMVKCTLQEFVFSYVNATTSIVATFDLQVNKGAFDTFVINFLTMGTKTCDTWFV